MDALKKKLQDLYLIFGVNLSIFSLEIDLIASYPEVNCSFCSMIKKTTGKEKCREFDRKAFSYVKDNEKMYIYKCFFNLYEACVPLYSNNQLSGFLMMGQMKLDSEMDDEMIRVIASRYIADDAELAEAIKSLPAKSFEQIKAFGSVLDVFGNYFSQTNKIARKQNSLASDTVSYIKTHYKEEINISKLCGIFFCSPATLNNNFKKEYGVSVHQYLLDFRLNRAKEMLRTSSFSVKEIALNVGFNDVGYFSKVYKKKYGVNPKRDITE